MFDKLKKAFSDATKNIHQKEISEKEINPILDNLLISLLESDIAHEVAEELTSNIRTEMTGSKIERKSDSVDLVKAKLFSYLADLFRLESKMDIISEILEKKKSKSGPYVILFLGINGAGKTTTIAKFTHLLQEKQISVVLAAGDTHRVEQLNSYLNMQKIWESKLLFKDTGQILLQWAGTQLNMLRKTMWMLY